MACIRIEKTPATLSERPTKREREIRTIHGDDKPQATEIAARLHWPCGIPRMD